jgi:hypothetical protein
MKGINYTIIVKISLGDDGYEHSTEERRTEITDLVPLKLNTNSEKTLK